MNTHNGKKIYPVDQVGNLWSAVNGDQNMTKREVFHTNLMAIHCDGDGKLKQEYDLGGGTVLNLGVSLMANDFNWIAAATPFTTLTTANYHASGTGGTAAALTDYWLQTAVTLGNLSGSTNGYFTGTQGTSANNIYTTNATVNYTNTLSITEWLLSTNNAAAITGTATSTTALTLVDTGAPFTNTGNFNKGWTVQANATAVNTPVTTAIGLVYSNNASTLNLANNTTNGSGSGASGWYQLNQYAASTPSGTTGFVLYPTAFDHKTFGVISVVNGDSISFKYSLVILGGG